MSTPTGARDQPSLVEELLGRLATPNDRGLRVEEYDAEGHHVVRADAPGVNPDRDICVTVDGGALRLRVERRPHAHVPPRSEIRYGVLERVLPLPHGVGAAEVTADYADGVLVLTMPLPGPSVPRAVRVTHRLPGQG